jgi:hypothetical protein
MESINDDRLTWILKLLELISDGLSTRSSMEKFWQILKMIEKLN